MAASREALCQEATCPICLDLYTDPVATDCGHNFCRSCLLQLWGKRPRRGGVPPCCPQCRARISQNSLRPNRPLANIVAIAKAWQEEEEEEGGGGGGCQQHQEPFKLFCQEDQAPICLVCDRATRHRGHRVLPIQEVAPEYKEKIKAHLESLKAEREKLQGQKLAGQQRMQDRLIQLETEKQMMTSFFEGLQKFIEEKKHFCLFQLGELEEEIKKGEEENLTKISEDISQLSQRITVLEKKCQQPASEYLQDIRNTLSRYKKNSVGICWTASPKLKRCSRIYFLRKTSDLREMPGTSSETASGGPSLLIDSLKQGMNQVNVTLDPITAHPRLFVSENLKVLRWDRVPQDLPYSPERFRKQPCVLGCERFTSGRHCWEVEILDGETQEEDLGGEPAWAVGIARNSVERREYFNLNLDEGIWAVGKACEDLSVPCQMSAFTTEPTTVILKKEPKRICVNLDYDAGQVDFLDADTEDLIFTFHSASFFGDQMRPFFYTRGWQCNLKS
ncbi:zinc finger protein RFP-like [Sceloporus undulatus]|uniref:zinc finger protein RFP-like n=1 Tax=Sceloporus undulatus TaxID=8520 RepID=UPI001C4C6880|nr:zinc finger protein RFP-like [Sceloporus undulatus]